MIARSLPRGSSLLRASPRDRAVLAAALAQGVATAMLMAPLAAAPPPSPVAAAAAVVAIALGVCWGSNTIAHIHLHTPLFRSRAGNRLFALYLTLLLRTPQTLWRTRHLAHHHPSPARRRARGAHQRAGTLVEGLLLAALAGAAAAASPHLLGLLALGQLLGLGLCFVQGRYEHRGAPAGVDHHGRLYNLLWFNDGHHAAHHRWPGRHWTALPSLDSQTTPTAVSRWPPLLRWLDDVVPAANALQATLLDRLERLALRSRWLQRFLITTHRRSFLPLLAHVPPGPARIGVVGGGLFPRTALVLRDLLPDAELALIDGNPRHLEQARARLGAAADRIALVTAIFDADSRQQSYDVVVIPLAYRGDRERLYRRPPAPVTLIHDWVWRRRGQDSRCISWLLLKRLNLVLT